MVLRSAPLAGRNGHEAGRQLLGEMYRELTGRPIPEIRTTPLGKPFFAEGNLHFSISHTPNWVFCVLSERPVGIDAEETNRSIDLRLADKILSSDEKAQFDRAENKQTALLRFWVLKEAAGKLTGQGLRVYPNHTDFDLHDPRIQVINNCFLAVTEE